MRSAVIAAALLAAAITAARAADQPMHDHAMGAASKPFDSGALGAIHHPVTTTSAEAQRLFDQGLALCFAFNHEEAVRSFQRALAADPRCAMAWWGIAYANGPNINLPMDSAHAVTAWDAVQQAKAGESGVGDEERALIDAMAARYASPPPTDRAALDNAYREAMKKVVERWPDDPDARAMYAESIMDLTPWSYWDHDGKPLRPDTDELVATLEAGLAKHPMHTGLNHFYIHAVEASASPERGLTSAHRLETLAPAAGHLVHMPTHVYSRVGDYWDAAQLNVKAARVDSAYVAAHAVEGVYPLMYWNHNHDFAASAFMISGCYAPALAHWETVRHAVLPVASEMPMAEFYAARPYVAMLEFHRWDQVLSEPQPAEGMRFSRLAWEFAQGVACAHVGRLDDAKSHLAALEQGLSALPNDYPTGTNTAPAVLAVARHMLEGAMARATGDLAAAETHYRDAVAAYDALHYDEPEDWLLWPREPLGGVLLARKDFAGAEKVFRDELAVHPKSGRALYGLGLALQGEGRIDDMKDVHAQLAEAWKHADRPLEPDDL